MHTRFVRTMLAIAMATATACSDGTKEESPGEVLARDSSLASELRQADTSAFAEAADVAMAFDPDSALPPVDISSPAPEPARASTPASSASPAAVPTPSVPLRVDRSASERTPTAAAPAAPAAGGRMRPAPATIHSDPIPTRRLPAAPAAAPNRRAATTSSASTASPPGIAAATREATRPRPAAPSAVAILERVPGASLPPAGSDEPCASPTTPNQRRCLMLHLARSDVMLDRTYQALIADIKREAGTPSGAKEPELVRQLRVAQRAWLVYRDTECRKRNRGKEGPLWAPVRAQCLGEFSGTRTDELAQALRERRGR